MSSPKVEAFAVFDPNTRLPKVGLNPTFLTYKDLGTSANLPKPAVFEIGGGGYYFVPTLTANQSIFYIIATGAEPPYYTRTIRAEDWYTDNADAPTSDVLAAVNDVKSQVIKVLGMVYENSVMCNQYYDGDGNLLRADIYQYDTPANLTLHDKVTGLINHWQIQSSFSQGVLVDYRIVRM